MICLIAASEMHARRWAKSQNLGLDEWFYPTNVFDLYRRKGGFHTILVHDGIDQISNDQLNKMLTKAWEVGRRRNG